MSLNRFMLMLSLLGIIGLTACDLKVRAEDGFVPISSLTDMGCPKPGDMTPTPPKCAAAKGLSGETLHCVDFSQIPMVPDSQRLPNWDFSCTGGASWTTMGGKVQVNNFDQFNSVCSLMLPTIDLNQTPYQQYKSITFSLVHSVDISSSQQLAQASLGSALPVRTFWTTTGKTERQQLTITLDRTDPVPMAAGGVYQYLLQITSGAKFSLQGWQIESIAVLGNR